MQIQKAINAWYIAQQPDKQALELFKVRNWNINIFNEHASVVSAITQARESKEVKPDVALLTGGIDGILASTFIPALVEVGITRFVPFSASERVNAQIIEVASLTPAAVVYTELSLAPLIQLAESASFLHSFEEHLFTDIARLKNPREKR